MSIKTTPRRILILSLVIVASVGSLVAMGIEVNRLRSFSCDGVVTSVKQSDNHKRLAIEVRNDDTSLVSIESSNLYLDEHKIFVGSRLTKEKASPGCMVDGHAYRFCD